MSTATPAARVPEGDSVWRVARTLDARLAGRTVVRSDLRVPRFSTSDLSGRQVLGTDTHGKHLLTRLSDSLTLHTHLRMDGSWSVLRPGRRLPRHVVPDVRVMLAMDDGQHAFAVRMPVVELVATAEEATVIGHLGPDPLRADWDAAEAVRRLASDPDRPLVAALLDQRLVAGLGNLWVNETCFLRGYFPWTPVSAVDLPRTVELAARMIRFSVDHPEAHMVTTGSARRGESHWVAGRAGKPCRRCGTVVRVRAEVPGDPGQRRTWWCPRCQPGPDGVDQ